MTHTLHPEIQDAVDKLVSEITKLKPGYYNADCLLDLERMILKCVGKYLSLPKPTPHIEKIDMDKLSMMLCAGSDSEGNSWSSDIPGAIKMLADYINNNLPPNKSNDQ